MKKGVIDIEFILALIVFLSVISFVTYSIILNIPTFRAEAYNEDLRAQAYEISQLLLFDQGANATGGPVWDASNVKRLGLSSGTNYVLDPSKISAMQSLCSSDYERARALLGQNQADFELTVSDSSSNMLLNCTPSITKLNQPKFQITRIAVVQGRLANMVVSVV